jgi:hypothetical protein
MLEGKALQLEGDVQRTWKEDVVNKSQEKQNIQAHEGGKNNLRSTREKMDSEDGSALLGDRCPIQNLVKDKVVVVCVYRSLDGNFYMFLNKLEEVIQKVQSKKEKINLMW